MYDNMITVNSDLMELLEISRDLVIVNDTVMGLASAISKALEEELGKSSNFFTQEDCVNIQVALMGNLYASIKGQ